MRPSESGILVTTVQYGSTAWGKLQKGDVLLELDRLPIANNGTVRYRGRFPLPVRRRGGRALRRRQARGARAARRAGASRSR
jgi:hypothetical protein